LLCESVYSNVYKLSYTHKWHKNTYIKHILYLPMLSIWNQTGTSPFNLPISSHLSSFANCSFVYL